MKRICALVALVAAFSAFAAAPTSKVPTAAGEYELNKWMGPVALRNSLGTKVREAHNTAIGVYDYSLVGGGISAALGVGITLPDNAIVRKAWFDVVTAPTSTAASDIKFQIQTSADLKAYLAKGSWSNQVAGIPDDTVAKMIKMTAARPVYMYVSGASLTAGKIKVYVDYVLSE